MCGFSPREVDEMSVWQFNAAVAGYVAANFPDDGKSLSEEDADALWALVSG